MSNKPDRIAICNLFRENLESIGVICNITPLEAAVFQERVFNKNYEAEMCGLGVGRRSVLEKEHLRHRRRAQLRLVFESGSRPAVRRRPKQNSTATKRAEIYGQIHNMIYEDQPYLFLYNVNSFYGFNKKLRGYRFSPRGPFHLLAR